jgi:hypothetical protein
MGLLDDGMSMLRESLMASETKSITYTRGASSVTLDAVPGETRSMNAEYGGAVYETKSLTFIIKSADLILGGVEVLPAQGDLIECNGVDYEVRSDGGNNPWSYVRDPDRTMIRIRTKAISQT